MNLTLKYFDHFTCLLQKLLKNQLLQKFITQFCLTEAELLHWIGFVKKCSTWYDATKLLKWICHWMNIPHDVNWELDFKSKYISQILFFLEIYAWTLNCSCNAKK